MPAEQALGLERFVVFEGRIEDHLDDTLDVAIGGSKRADVHAQPARK